MSGERPASAAPSASAVPSVPAVHPAPPVPPRSRLGWHLGALAAAILGGAVAFLALSAAGPSLLAQAPSVGAPAGPALLAVLAAAVLLGVGWLGARTSLGLTVTGGLWLALGLVVLIGPGSAGPLTDWLTDQVGSLRLREGAHDLLTSAAVAALGAALLGGAFAVRAARTAGRFMQRREARTVARGDHTVPPGSRLGAHVGAIVLALVLTPPAVALLDGAAAQVGQVRLSDAVAALACLLIVGASGALSSLGPATGAAVWLASWVQVVATGEPSAIARVGAPALRVFGRPDGGVGLVADVTGVSLALAAALLGVALGAHYARLDGRALERREAELSVR